MKDVVERSRFWNNQTLPLRVKRTELSSWKLDGLVGLYYPRWSILTPDFEVMGHKLDSVQCQLVSPIRVNLFA